MMKKLLIIFILISTATFAQNFYIGASDPSCQGCHANIIPSWQETAHADALAAGLASDHFGYSCLQCHTVGWDVNVDNNGADEYVTEGENNTYTITDQDEFDKLSNVQCESCHGPKGNSSGGVDFSHTSDNTVHDLSAEVCGQCHTDVHHPTFENWQESKHAVSKFTSIPGFEFIASDPNCSACHTAEGFLQFLESDDLEPEVEAPGAEGNDITCSACHDPHSAENHAQLRLPAAEICQKCHNPEYNPDEVPEPDGSAVHHSTAYMFEGKGGYEYAGVEYSSSAHKFAVQDKCVSCHVYMLPYQGGDPEIPAYTGHTFEPIGESCVDCHSDFDPADESFDYRETQTEIAGLLEKLATRLANASSEDSTTEAFYRAQFNHDFVESDGSMGIHNTAYAKGLLESSLADFNPVSVEPVAGTPNSYELGQNYPNPFNPTTTINFSIPKAAQVQLVIYDAIGNEIEVLVNKSMSAGNYKFEWNASNLASGIYLYKLITDEFVQAKKMLLMK